MPLRTIIIDDEPAARKGLEEECKDIAFLHIVGIAANSFQALELVKTLHPDLLLLDIEMPGLSGLDLIKSMKDPPMVIITTAYSEYALEGYELDVMDYLIKPVDFPRLCKACCKARDFHQLKEQAGPLVPDYFFVKCNGKHEKVAWHDLLFVEAADNYIMVHLSGRKLMAYQTLKSMEGLLPAAHFMKVHKSFIVALDKVTRLEGQDLLIEKFRIPVSRNLKDLVRERILHRSSRIPPGTL